MPKTTFNQKNVQSDLSALIDQLTALVAAKDDEIEKLKQEFHEAKQQRCCCQHTCSPCTLHHYPCLLRHYGSGIISTPWTVTYNDVTGVWQDNWGK